MFFIIYLFMLFFFNFISRTHKNITITRILLSNMSDQATYKVISMTVRDFTYSDYENIFKYYPTQHMNTLFNHYLKIDYEIKKN